VFDAPDRDPRGRTISVAFIAPVQTELDQAESQVATVENRVAEERNALSLAEHRYAQARINAARRNEILESLRTTASKTISAWSAPLTLGTNGNLQNSQCQINPASAWVSGIDFGTDLSLSVTIGFLPAFAGLKNIWAEALDSLSFRFWSSVRIPFSF
jgi:hypothetical protein